MIPKVIWTAWFGDSKPEVVRKSLKSQNIPGYQLFILNEKNFQDDSLTRMSGVPEYIKIALENKKWVKATDYIRAWVLYKYGGIFLDADQEILPGKNFDDLLHMKLFAAKEENGFIGYSLVGSEPNHPLWEEYFKRVDENFTPLDGKNFESSMEIFTHLMFQYSRPSGFCSQHRAPTDPNCKICFPNKVTILSPDYFFPYNHQTGIIAPSENTRTFHHFMKTWNDKSPDLLPTVSIIIPQLGREEGLKRCLDSIDHLLYPKHLIETIVIKGGDTVPKKVEEGLKMSKGDYIVYAANDIEFTPMSLYYAIKKATEPTPIIWGNCLVAFNTGDVLPDEGNICEHFVIRKAVIPFIGGQIFDTDFHHTGVDNLLWAKVKALAKPSGINGAIRCEEAIVHHYHFSKGAEYDEVYKKGWDKVDQDRELLKQKLKEINYA